MTFPDTRYLHFRDAALSTRIAKTRVIEVEMLRTGETLGSVRWRSHWREYVFCPADRALFSLGCLQDICVVIERLRAERKEAVALRQETEG